LLQVSKKASLPHGGLGFGQNSAALSGLLFIVLIMAYGRPGCESHTSCDAHTHMSAMNESSGKP
jgi:hypothetical protein